MCSFVGTATLSKSASNLAGFVTMALSLHTPSTLDRGYCVTRSLTPAGKVALAPLLLLLTGVAMVVLVAVGRLPVCAALSRRLSDVWLAIVAGMWTPQWYRFNRSGSLSVQQALLPVVCSADVGEYDDGGEGRDRGVADPAAAVTAASPPRHRNTGSGGSAVVAQFTLHRHNDSNGSVRSGAQVRPSLLVSYNESRESYQRAAINCATSSC